jgi:hypothetical protein
MIVSPQGRSGGAPCVQAVGISPAFAVSGTLPPLVSDIDPVQFQVLPLPEPGVDFEPDTDPTRFRVIL